MKQHAFFTGLALILLLTTVSLQDAVCQGLPVSKPENVKMSSKRLERIAPLMKQYIDKGDVHGCVTLVARRGKTVHLDAQGYMDAESKKPVQTDTIFRIASMSKPVTATAAMILYEEGRFLMSDPVSKYIPEFADMTVLVSVETGIPGKTAYATVPAKHEMIVRHIFNHTSGITYGGGALADYYREANISSGLRATDETIGDMVKRLAKLPLNHHPGEQWEYGLSNDVLGYFIEVVSGMPLDRFFQERIFDPLGMKDTSFYPPKDKLDRVATVYSLSDGALRRQPDSETDAQLMGARRYFSGGGGLFSTAPDYIRFAQMLLNGGELDGVRILSRKSVELMTTDSTGGIDILVGTGHTRATHGDRYGLGLGIRAYTGDIESIGTFGWGGAFNTLFWVDPEEELIGVFMSQVRGQPDKTMHRVFRILAYSAIDD